MSQHHLRSFLRSARIWMTVLLSGLPLAALLAGCGEEKPAAPAAALPKVVVAEAKMTRVPRQASFNGILAAKETVEVRARVSGYLAERLFEEGAIVTPGQVLYKLDDRDLKAALDTAKANTAKAKANWKNADTTKDRMVTLADKGAVSLQMRDNSVAQADEALAAYQAAQADEEKASINLGYATIISPINGYISRSAVDVGSYVDAGGATLMATIYKIDPIRAEFSITDGEYARMKKALDEPGSPARQPAVFTLELGDDRILYKYPGTLEMDDPVIDSKTNTLGVRAEFPNPDHALRPGMYVNVIATDGEQEVLVVPEVAVVDQTTSKAVYTVDTQNILAVVPVIVGALVGDQRIISQGLTAGQKVVVEGLVTARPGLKVEVMVKELAPAAGTGGAAKAAPSPAEKPSPDAEAPSAEKTAPAPAASAEEISRAEKPAE